jgi:MFS family permease
MNQMDPLPPNKNVSELPFKRAFFYGWVIVGISALASFFTSPGQTYSVSAFIDSYIAEFGWSRAQVSAMYSTGCLAAGLFMGVIGRLFDRLGYRIMTTLAAFAFGMVCLGMSFATSLIVLAFGFMAIRMLGPGSLGLSSSTLPPQWFSRKKGKALSIVAIGGTASLAFTPLINTWLIGSYGWRFGWIFWGILLWAIMVPIAYLYIRNQPEDVGLWPDNQKMPESPISTVDISLDHEEAWTAKEAMHTRSFWLLLYCRIVPSAILTGLVFHQYSILNQAGLSAEIAALSLSSMAIVNLPIALISGPIADRIPPRYLIALAEFIQFVVLVVILYVNSISMAIIYGALLGVVLGLVSIGGSVIWPEYYGRRYLGSITGITMTAGVIGSATGPLPFGLAYDLFGGYQEILIIFMIFPLIATIAALIASSPRKKEQ